MRTLQLLRSLAKVDARTRRRLFFVSFTFAIYWLLLECSASVVPTRDSDCFDNDRAMEQRAVKHALHKSCISVDSLISS